MEQTGAPAAEQQPMSTSGKCYKYNNFYHVVQI